jgi:FecR protein
MTPPRKCIATKAGVSLALLFIAALANAASIGTVTELDGNLLVSRASGSVKVLGVGSEIEQGDVLISRSQTYATLTLADDSAITLGPDTNVKVERYVFYKHTPDNDGALLALAKGSVRITTGLLGTRSGDTFTLATPTSTLDVRRASVIVQYVPDDRARLSWHDAAPRDSRESNMLPVAYGLRLAQVPKMPATPTPTAGGVPPGLYIQVLDGLINLSNPGGTQVFSAGQFGFTPNMSTPPIILPQNPGLQFTPPPSFSSSAPSTSGTSPPKSNAVDCVVR